MFDDLNEDNILLYCAKAYDKPSCVMREFHQDLKRINYLIRLFSRYKKYGNVRERLAINHLVVLYNVFGVEACTRILFYRVPKEYYPILKTFLVFLSVMPQCVKGIRGEEIISSNIPLNYDIVNSLRDLLKHD